MVKLKSKIRTPPGMSSFEFRYSPDFVEELKLWPGPRYAPEIAKGVWLIPDELVGDIVRLASAHRVDPRVGRFPQRQLAMPAWPNLPAELYPYQREAAGFLVQHGRGLIAHEMGLGKAATAISALRTLISPESRLIITPASVRSTWRDELIRWAGAKPDDVLLIECGADWGAVELPKYVVTSYELLGEAAAEWVWSGIVIDESHYCKNEGSARSKAVRRILASNPLALAIELTGTPIADDPADLWHQLDLLWPGRFGTFWKFQRRYCASEPSKYAHSGFTYRGLTEHPEHRAELSRRLLAVSHRATAAEVAHLLPPLSVQAIRLKPPQFVRDFGRMALQYADKTSAERYMAAAAVPKADAAVDRVFDAIEQGSTHICLVAYHRSTARRLYDEFAITGKVNGFTLGYVDGEMPHDKRKAEIARCAGSPRSILIVTMKSVCVGINSLVDFTHAILVELYYSPEVVLQMLKRFNRLNSKRASKVEMLIFDGTIDEVIASRLGPKISDINALIRAGAAEQAIDAALNQVEDELSFLKSLSESRKVEKDGYD